MAEHYLDNPYYALQGNEPYYASNLPGNIALGEADDEMYYRSLNRGKAAPPKLNTAGAAQTQAQTVAAASTTTTPSSERFVPLKNATIDDIFRAGSSNIPLTAVVDSLKMANQRKEQYVALRNANVSNIFRQGSAEIPLTVTEASLRNKEHMTVSQALGFFKPRKGGSHVEYLDAAGVEASLSALATQLSAAGSSAASKLSNLNIISSLGQIPAAIAAKWKTSPANPNAVPAVVVPSGSTTEYLLPESKITTHQGIKLLQPRGNNLERFVPNRPLTVSQAFSLFKPRERFLNGLISKKKFAPVGPKKTTVPLSQVYSLFSGPPSERFLGFGMKKAPTKPSSVPISDVYSLFDPPPSEKFLNGVLGGKKSSKVAVAPVNPNSLPLTWNGNLNTLFRAGSPK